MNTFDLTIQEQTEGSLALVQKLQESMVQIDRTGDGQYRVYGADNTYHDIIDEYGQCVMKSEVVVRKFSNGMRLYNPQTCMYCSNLLPAGITLRIVTENGKDVGYKCFGKCRPKPLEAVPA